MTAKELEEEINSIELWRDGALEELQSKVSVLVRSQIEILKRLEEMNEQTQTKIGG